MLYTYTLMALTQ